MTGNSRIKIKLPNGAEFDAEGAPDDVKAQYHAFVELMKAAPIAAQPIATTPSGHQANSLSSSEPTEDELNRVFAKDEAGRISLKILPKGDYPEADALLALMYGYLKLAKTENVFGATLSVAASKSGVQFDRIDRTLAVHEKYWKRGGFKRGATYTLNNQGILAGAEVVKRLLE